MPKPLRLPSLAARLAVALLLAVSAPAAARAQPAPDALRAALTRADSLFFDALFQRCSAEEAVAWLAEDAEFYDDRTGLSAGTDLRGDFRRIADQCPSAHGVRRVLLPQSVEVHAIPGFGAVQRGEHHFVERGAATSTVARFVHLWRREGDGWRLARIVSLHETMDAARAAARRGEGVASMSGNDPAPSNLAARTLGLESLEQWSGADGRREVAHQPTDPCRFHCVVSEWISPFCADCATTVLLAGLRRPR